MVCGAVVSRLKRLVELDGRLVHGGENFDLIDGDRAPNRAKKVSSIIRREIIFKLPRVSNKYRT